MKKELLVIGAGNIGRGVIGGLFFESGYHLYIYDIMEERMKAFSELTNYVTPEIRQFSESKILILKETICKERKFEADRFAEREQRFE